MAGPDHPGRLCGCPLVYYNLLCCCQAVRLSRMNWLTTKICYCVILYIICSFIGRAKKGHGFRNTVKKDLTFYLLILMKFNYI